MSTELERLKKENEYLKALTKNQQDALDIYKKRLNKIKRSLKNPFFGASFLVGCIKRKFWRHFPGENPKEYDRWIRQIEETYDNEATLFDSPSISIILVCQKENLQQPDQSTIASIAAQTYKSTELIISDMDSIYESVLQTKGDYVIFLEDKSILSKHALYATALSINTHKDSILFYSDEDCINPRNGRRFNPYFKPDYSPDTLASFFYTSGLSVYKKSSLISTFNTELLFNSLSVFMYHYTRLLCNPDSKITHIQRVLLHCTQKPFYSLAAEIKYPVVSEKISIIIPSKDNFPVLQKCINSILHYSSYKNIEIIVVDNGSSLECKQRVSDFLNAAGQSYIYAPMDFNFSKMCNLGAQNATGDYLLFLNDDIEVTTKTNTKWLEILLGCARESHVGAVGAKLLYPKNNIIQHDGVINGLTGPIHALHYGKDTKDYYHGRNKYNFNVSAVTGAALIVSKSKFDEIGGFDVDLAVGFNDIDLCYSLCEKGFYNVIRNDVVLIHHESVSRGNDEMDSQKMDRWLTERRYLYTKHPQYLSYDPFYHPLLTRTNTDYSLNISDF